MTLFPKICISIQQHVTTPLHNAGLHGLIKALNHIKKKFPDPLQRPGRFDWQEHDDGIELFWEENDFQVLDWLFKNTFGLDDNGIICFNCLFDVEEITDARMVFHIGLTNTLMQHNKSSKFVGREIYVSNSNERFKLPFRKVESYAYQNFAERICSKKGELMKGSIKINSYVYPGASVRHSAYASETSFQESIESAFISIFAPMECQFYFISPKINSPSEKQHYGLVFPEYTKSLQNRETKTVKNKTIEYFCVESLEEGGFKFLLNEPDSNLSGCFAYEFGVSIASPKQKNKLNSIYLPNNEKNVRQFRYSEKNFGSKRCLWFHNFSPYFSDSIHCQIIKNVAYNRPWWDGFSTGMSDKYFARSSFHESHGILEMVMRKDFENEANFLFIQACHEALRKTYAMAYDHAPKGSHVDIEKLNEKLRFRALRFKGGALFRQFIAEFFVRAGPNSIMEESMEKISPLLTDESQWKKVRDLFFLSLVSYPKSKK